MFQDTRIVQTPRGPREVSVSIGSRLAGLPRFDSSISDFIAEQIIAKALPHLRNDAGTTAIFARQLEYLFAEVIKVEYPALRATEFIPLNTEPPPGSLSYTYRMWDAVGKAKVITNYADDLPKVTVEANEWQSPIITTGMSYDFGVQDVARAALGNFPLEQGLADAARFAIEFLGEDIACTGYAAAGVPGMVNAPGVAATAQVSTGTWLAQIATIASASPSTPATAVAVAQDLIMDIQAMKKKVWTNTKGLYPATTVLLPSTLWTALDAVPRSPAFTDDTLLDYMRKITGLDIDYWLPLDTAGSGGHGRVMCYRKDPQVLQLVRARSFTQLPPQAINLAWQVPCLAEEGGVMVKRPGAVTYMDGLDG